MLKVRAVIICMLFAVTDLFCMTPVRRIVQQLPVRTLLSQSVRASSTWCDCSP